MRSRCGSGGAQKASAEPSSRTEPDSMKLLLILLTVRLKLLSVAAASQSALTCNVTLQADGSYKYELSRPPRSASCTTCFEDHKELVIARDSDYNQTLVKNLTNHSIFLKHCFNHIRYTKDCSGEFEEADCRVNCSRLLDHLPTTVNTTLNCLSGSWCPTQQTLCFVIAGICLLAICVFVGLFVWMCISKRRMRQSVVQTASYSAVNEQIKAVEPMYIV